MKRYILILITSLLPFPGLCQNNIPDYWSVVHKFFSTYHHDNTPEEQLYFARKKDGWHIQIINYPDSERVTSDQLFWSLQKGRYQVLENFLGANEDPAEKKAIAFITKPGVYNT